MIHPISPMKIHLRFTLLIAAALTLFLAGGTFAQSLILKCQSDVRAKNFEAALISCEAAKGENAGVASTGKAIAYSELLKWPDAIRELTTVISINSNAVDLLYYRANAYYQNGEYRNAISDLERALRLAPQLKARLTTLLVQAKEMSDLTSPRKPSAAAEKKSLELSLAANTALVNRAVAVMNKAKPAELEKFDQQVLSLVLEALAANKYNAHAYSVRGSLYVAQKKDQPAIFEFSKAILVDPKDATAYESRAKAYREAKEYLFAIADLSKAIELKPDNSMLYFSRAELFELAGKNAEALVDLDTCVRLRPNSSFGYIMRARFLMKHGMIDKAISDLNAALKIDPKDAASLEARCEYYNLKGNFSAALKDCTAGVDRAEPFVSDTARFERIATYIGLKKFDLALADVAALEKGGPYAALSVQKGKVYKAQGKKAEAIKAFNEALASDPKNADAKKELASLAQ
ncbi:MAG: tetratricopeptide repeat protein [Acidobacteria bacterium ACB1]|nr:tetratricopeptide repeat protein [Acidobacteria bacterium ACB1]